MSNAGHHCCFNHKLTPGKEGTLLPLSQLSESSSVVINWIIYTGNETLQSYYCRDKSPKHEQHIDNIFQTTLSAGTILLLYS